MSAPDRALPSLIAPQPSLSWPEAIVYFLLAASLDIVVAVTTLPKVLAGSLLNPDSYMRLVRLQDMLDAHALLHAVARDASGSGTVLAWSHLLDAIILLIAAPLLLFTDEAHALLWAGIALGPIGVGLLGLATAWVLSPLTPRAWRWTAPVLVALSGYVIGYGLPGVVHHHVLVAVLIIATAGFAGRTAFNVPGAGRSLGVSAALGIWLSPETLPFTLLSFGFVGLAWLAWPQLARQGTGLRAAGTSFLALIVVACVIDPPSGGYGAVEIDRISVVYVVLGVFVFMLGHAIAWLGQASLGEPLRRAIGFGAGAAAIVAWFALFPAVLQGPNGLMSADEARAFFGIISEMQPLVDPRSVIGTLFNGALATLALIALTLRERSWMWGYAAACSALLLILSVMHSRFATYPEVLAAAIVPLVLAQAQTWVPARAAPFVRVALFALFFLGRFSGDLILPSSAMHTSAVANCDLRTIGPLLAPYGGEVVLANADDTPELLYRTGVKTVGSLYHRNVAAFMRQRAAWRRGPSDTVPEAVEATRANFVLFCPSVHRSPIVGDLPATTLLDRLNRGEIPRWLAKLGEDRASGRVLYKIVR